MTTNLSIEEYSKYKTWKQFYPDNKVNLKKIKYDESYEEMFQILFKDKRLENLENALSKDLKDDDTDIHPAPELVFNAFLLTPLHNIKVFAIGQDPYFDHETFDGINVHQAMGLSYSVPYGMKTPSSLENIYKNQLKFGHIKNIPTNGNLEFWAIQGCLLLNSALTVKDGKENKNCHQNNWRWFTDTVIRYISDKCENIVFVLWGSDALAKLNLIDVDKHEVIISSHPSGLSCAKPLGSHKPFNEVDHFGKINQFLIKNKKSEIIWNN